jgi:hypothetical protein
MNKWVTVVVLVILLITGYWLWEDDSLQEGQSSVNAPAEIMEPQAIIRSPVQDGVSEPDQPDAMGSFPGVPKRSSPAVMDERPLLPGPQGLEGSDKGFLEVAGELSPAMLQWLLPEQQIRKWVLAVDLLADGQLPKRYRPLSYSQPAFAVKSVNGGWIVDSANAGRSDALVDAVVAIDQQRLIRYYEALYPVLEKAYAELGKPGTFHQRLAMAIDRILKTGAVDTNATLKRPHVLYQYQASQLESRSDLEKCLWRMGDVNRQRLQAWLADIQKRL